MRNITSPTTNRMRSTTMKNLSSPTKAGTAPFRQYNVKTPHNAISNRKGYAKSRPANWKGWASTTLGASGSGGAITCIKVVGSVSSKTRIIQNLLNYSGEAGITADKLQRWADINAGVLPEGEDADVKLRTEDEVIDDTNNELAIIDEKYDNEIAAERMIAEREIAQHEEEAADWRARPAATRPERAANLAEAKKCDRRAKNRYDQFMETKTDLIANLKAEREDKRDELQAERQKEVEQYEEAVKERVKELEQVMEDEIEQAANAAFHLDDEYVADSIALS